jgi:hypothetical protein
MKEDAVVAEVRRIRDEHAARFNYDLDAIVEDFRKREKEGDSPVVSLPSKRIPLEGARG